MKKVAQKTGPQHEKAGHKAAKLLSDAAAFVEKIDPLSGPNIMKHGSVRDNGDGTLTFIRPKSYKTLDT